MFVYYSNKGSFFIGVLQISYTCLYSKHETVFSATSVALDGVSQFLLLMMNGTTSLYSNNVENPKEENYTGPFMPQMAQYTECPRWILSLGNTYQRQIGKLFRIWIYYRFL